VEADQIVGVHELLELFRGRAAATQSHAEASGQKSIGRQPVGYEIPFPEADASRFGCELETLDIRVDLSIHRNVTPRNRGPL
jgi:hypothetical protein